MQDEELTTWLKTLVSVERCDLLIGCIETLYAIDHTGMTELSNNILTLVGEDTNDNLHDKFVNELIYLQVTQIRQFSIIVSADRLTLASVGPLNSILATLYQLDDVDDKVALNDILLQEESPEMTLAMLIIHYDPTQSDTVLLEHLAYVPSELIAKIGDENPMDEHHQELRLPDSARARIAIGLNEPDLKTPVTQYVERGGILGLGFVKYLAIHFPSISTMTDLEEIANSWTMLLLFTGQPIDQLRTLYPTYLEKLYESVGQIKQIHQYIKTKLDAIEAKERDYDIS